MAIQPRADLVDEIGAGEAALRVPADEAAGVDCFAPARQNTIGVAFWSGLVGWLQDRMHGEAILSVRFWCLWGQGIWQRKVF